MDFNVALEFVLSTAVQDEIEAKQEEKLKDDNKENKPNKDNDKENRENGGENFKAKEVKD